MSIPVFRVTQRTMTVSFPEGAPDIPLAHGHRHLSPLFVKVTRHFDGTWLVEATGHTRKQDGGLAKALGTYLIPVVPEWLMGVLDAVHVGLDQ